MSGPHNNGDNPYMYPRTSMDFNKSDYEGTRDPEDPNDVNTKLIESFFEYDEKYRKEFINYVKFYFNEWYNESRKKIDDNTPKSYKYSDLTEYKINGDVKTRYEYVFNHLVREGFTLRNIKDIIDNLEIKNYSKLVSYFRSEKLRYDILSEYIDRYKYWDMADTYSRDIANYNNQITNITKIFRTDDTSGNQWYFVKYNVNEGVQKTCLIKGDIPKKPTQKLISLKKTVSDTLYCRFIFTEDEKTLLTLPENMTDIKVYEAIQANPPSGGKKSKTNKKRKSKPRKQSRKTQKK